MRNSQELPAVFIFCTMVIVRNMKIMPEIPCKKYAVQMIGVVHGSGAGLWCELAAGA